MLTKFNTCPFLQLLRTIENLNKIADHKSEVEKRRKSVDPSHNMFVTERVGQLPDAIGIRHDELNRKTSQRKETQGGILQEDKSSVLKSRLWINKPIEQLTHFVEDSRTGNDCKVNEHADKPN